MVSLDDLACAEDKQHGGHLFAGGREGEWEEWRTGLFLDMCILAGCDYLHSLPNVGVRTAHTLLRQHRRVRAVVIQLCGGDGEQAREYLRRFAVARDIFRHQLVWDGRGLVPLTPLPAGSEMPAHIGQMLRADVARSVCVDARLDPRTLQPVPLQLTAPSTGRLRAPAAPARACAEPASQAAAAADDRLSAGCALNRGRDADAEPDETRSRFFDAAEAEPLAGVARVEAAAGSAAALAVDAPALAPGQQQTSPAATELRAPPATAVRTSLRRAVNADAGRGASARQIPTLSWRDGGGRVGLAPPSPPVVPRAVLASIDQLCP
ncbi:hypothetical protein T492DRAFT_1152724, partial [Pavlovales sp. CCMP2436]